MKNYIIHKQRQDGFGAQLQTIINTIIFAELNNYEYIYVPFKEMEHNYNNDPDYIEKKENLINFRKYFTKEYDTQCPLYDLDIMYSIQFFENNIDICMKSNSLKYIKNIFVETNFKNYKYKDKFVIAVHVRRPNPHDNRLIGADVPDDFYLNNIKDLLQKYSIYNPEVHIYSQGSSENFKEYKDKGYKLFLNGAVEECFINLVFANVLHIAPSSLSYVAGLLSNGDIYYKEFWHITPKHWINKNS